MSSPRTAKTTTSDLGPLPTASARSNDRWLKLAAPFLVGIIFLGGWEAAVRIMAIPPYILPTPSRIIETLVSDWPTLAASLRITLAITFSALAAAVVVGGALAILFTQFKWVELALFPYAVILQVTPIVAIAPLIIIWVNDTNLSLLICAWIVAFFLAPLAIVWAYSFGQNVGLTEVDISGTLANYLRALEPLYLGILAKSIFVAALTTLLCLVIGFPVALAIVFASERWRPWMLLLIMLPFWTNLLIRTYALIAVLRTQGYVNFGLEWMWDHASLLMTLAGLQPLGEFEPLKLLYNNFAVVFGLVYVHLPFMVLPLYAALDRIDKSLIEASLDLGAGHMRTLFSIVVPLAMPGIVSGIIITFVPALGAYLTPDLLGGPDSQMIANVIERQFKRANDWPFGAALSFLLMYATFAVIALRAYWSRGQEAEKHGL